MLNTVSAALTQPTFDRSARRSPTVTAQLCRRVPQTWPTEFPRCSSGTRFRHGCPLALLVVDNSEMGLILTSSYKHTALICKFGDLPLILILYVRVRPPNLKCPDLAGSKSGRGAGKTPSVHACEVNTILRDMRKLMANSETGK